MFPGWTTPWYEDGSGWTASDEFSAREEGWNLLINADQISPYSIPATAQKSDAGNFFIYTPIPDNADFMPKLLEKAMTGNKTAIKGLYLMAYNDVRHKEWIPVVNAIMEKYELKN